MDVFDTYLEIEGFTGEADLRFASFLSNHAKATTSAPARRLDCLAIMEMQLNDDRYTGPYCWELEGPYSRDGQGHLFNAELQDFQVKRHDLPEITSEAGALEDFE